MHGNFCENQAFKKNLKEQIVQNVAKLEKHTREGTGPFFSTAIMLGPFISQSCTRLGHWVSSKLTKIFPIAKVF